MRRLLVCATAALALTLGMAGLASAQPARETPPLQAEPPPPPPPGPRYVWEPGHWHWNGGAYVWVGGHYMVRHPGWHEFVHGHWAQRAGGWVWVPAHWR
jgi:WXXGXW repeat (2 copies)